MLPRTYCKIGVPRPGIGISAIWLLLSKLYCVGLKSTGIGCPPSGVIRAFSRAMVSSPFSLALACQALDEEAVDDVGERDGVHPGRRRLHRCALRGRGSRTAPPRHVRQEHRFRPGGRGRGGRGRGWAPRRPVVVRLPGEAGLDLRHPAPPSAAGLRPVRRLTWLGSVRTGRRGPSGSAGTESALGRTAGDGTTSADRPGAACRGIDGSDARITTARSRLISGRSGFSAVGRRVLACPGPVVPSPGTRATDPGSGRVGVAAAPGCGTRFGLRTRRPARAARGRYRWRGGPWLGRSPDRRPRPRPRPRPDRPDHTAGSAADTAPDVAPDDRAADGAASSLACSPAEDPGP